MNSSSLEDKTHWQLITNKGKIVLQTGRIKRQLGDLTAWKSSRWVLPKALRNLKFFLLLLTPKVWQSRQASSQREQFHDYIALIILISADLIFLPCILLLAPCLFFLVFCKVVFLIMFLGFPCTSSATQKWQCCHHDYYYQQLLTISKLKWIGCKNHLFRGKWRIAFEVIMPRSNFNIQFHIQADGLII